MTTTHGEPKRPNAGIGELVTIDGYGNRVFRVDSTNYEYYLDEEVEHDGIFYETTDVRTFEMLLADDVDITVVSPSENARKYLQMNIAKPKPRAELPSIDGLLTDLRSTVLIVDR